MIRQVLLNAHILFEGYLIQCLAAHNHFSAERRRIPLNRRDYWIMRASRARSRGAQMAQEIANLWREILFPDLQWHIDKQGVELIRERWGSQHSR